MHYHAVLKNAFKLSNSVVGHIYDDKKGRFPDGAQVRTSYVEDIIEEDGKTYVKTLNTTYLIEGSVARV